MGKPLTKEYVMKYLREEHNLEAVGEYIDANTPFACKTQEGYIVMIKVSSLKSGRGFSIFESRNPHTLENIKLWIKINKLNLELLETKYIGNKHKMECKCTICKHTWSINWHNIQSGYGCPKCAGVTKPTIEEIKDRLKIINPNIEILSDDFKSAHSKLKCRCLIDAREWETKWHHLKNGHGCNECHIREHEFMGYYTKSNAMINKDDWINKPCKVYAIRCYKNDEEFFKIGITQTSISKRFKKSNFPYNYDTVYEYDTNLFEAVFIEGGLHYAHSEYKYIPKIVFSGFTECFSSLLEQEV